MATAAALVVDVIAAATALVVDVIAAATALVVDVIAAATAFVVDVISSRYGFGGSSRSGVSLEEQPRRGGCFFVCFNFFNQSTTPV